MNQPLHSESLNATGAESPSVATENIAADGERNLALWQTYYGISGDPFQLDQSAFFLTADRQQALETLRYLAGFSDDCIFLLGDSGVGKSTLLEALAADLEDELKLVSVQLGDVRSRAALVSKLAEAFALEVGQLSATQLIDALKDEMRLSRDSGRRVVLAIDDATELASDALDLLVMELRATSESNLFALLLLANRQIEAELERVSQQLGREDWFQVVPLPALTQAETTEYVQFRLRLAGWAGSPVVAPRLLQKLYDQTGGNLAKINAIAPSMLLSKAPKVVKRKTIPKAYWQWSGLTTLLLLGSVALVAHQYRQSPAPSTLSIPVDLAAPILPAEEPQGGSNNASSVQESVASTAERPEEGQLPRAGSDALVAAPEADVPADSSPQAATNSAAPDTDFASAKPVPDSSLREPVGVLSGAAAQGSSETNNGATNSVTGTTGAPVEQVETAQGGNESAEHPVKPKESPDSVTKNTMSAQMISADAATKAHMAKSAVAAPSAKAVVKASHATQAAVKQSAQAASGTVPLYRDRAWVLQQAPTDYTIQLLGSYHEQTVKTFIEKHPQLANLFYAKTQHEKQDWYIVLHGLYHSRKLAQNTAEAYPSSLKKQNPWIRKLKGLQDEVRAAQ